MRFLSTLLLGSALCLGLKASAQICTPATFATATQVPSTAYPKTFSSGVTASVRLVTIDNFSSTYPSGSPCLSSFSSVADSWWIGSGSGADSIIITFSQPVTHFSMVITGTDAGEEFTINSGSTKAYFTDFCSNFVYGTTTNKIKLNSGGTGTYASVTDTTGSTTFVITHNMTLAGSLINLLDCIETRRGPAGIVDGIQLWLDGSDVGNDVAANPADGTKLGIWKDISGNNNDARVLAGQDTAQLKTANINGKDVVSFSRTSTFKGTIYEVPNVDIRAVSMPKTTIFTVYKPTFFSSSILQGIWGDDNANWDRFFNASFLSTNGIVSVGPPTDYVSVTNAGTINDTKLLTAVYHAGVTDSSVVYFNALPVARVTDNTDSTDAQTNLRIGWDGDDNPFIGEIAEMVVYNRKLSICEIKAVNRYFGQKYNVSFTTATITPSSTQYICGTGASATLTASTGTAYKWLRDGSVISGATSSTYAATANGSYRVVVTADGCDDTSAATVVRVVPSRIYVDSSKAVSAFSGASWDSSLNSVSEALALAHKVTCPVEIWIKKGTYYPMVGNAVTTSRDSAFRIFRNDIKLYGGFAGTETALTGRVAGNTTTFSGDINVANDSTDNLYHILTLMPSAGVTIDTTGTIIDNITFTRGNGYLATGGVSINGQGINRQDAGALYLGGASTVFSCSPKVTNCTFIRNSANFGGAVYAASFNSGTSSPVFDNCLFESNNASNSAGAVFGNSNGSSPTNNIWFRNTTFKNNSAVNAGGAVIIERGGSATPNVGVFYNCTFTGNSISTASGSIYGSAVCVRNGYNTTFKYCTFQNNNGYRGVVSFAGAKTLTMDSCLFKGNTAVVGAGLDFQNITDGTISNTNFLNNYATDYGVLNAQSGTVGTMSVTNCYFDSNASANSGAAITLAGTAGGTLTVNTSRFTRNEAAVGGVVSMTSTSATATFNRTAFYSNKASTQGGVANATAGTTNFNNCVFSTNSNTGGNGGGAIFASGGTVNVNSSTLNNNTTSSSTNPGANTVRLASGGTLKIVNSIVWGTATTQLSIAGTATYINSDLRGTTAAAPNLDFDPRFVNSADADGPDNIWGTADDGLYLNPCSPVINRGSNTDLGSITVDYLNNARIKFTTTDMGAYEIQDTTLPGVPTVVSPVTYCQGVVASPLTATKASASDTLKWYDATLTLLSGTPTPSTTTPGTVNYYVTGKSANGCESNKAAISVVVNPTPAAPVSTTSVVYCQNATATALSATLASGSSGLIWYNSSMVALGSAPTPSTATVGTQTFYVSQKTALNCEGPKTTITVTINPQPATPTVVSPVTYCQNATPVVLTATKSAGADTLKWYDPSSALLAAAPTPSTATAGTTSYFVSEKNSFNCESNKATINVVVNPTPAAPTTATSVVYCQNATASPLSATLASGASALVWYNSSMTVLAGAPTPSTSTVGTTTYYVSQKTALNCEGPKTTITVTVNPQPATPTVVTPVTYCQNATAVALTATKAAGADTLKWYDPSSTLLAAAPTPSTATPGTTSYFVTEKNGFNCESNKATINVVVNALPNVPATTTTYTYCEGDVPTTLSATKPSSTDTLKWYNSSMTLLAAAPTPSTVTAGTFVWYVSAKSAQACEGAKATITVTVNPKPAAPAVVTPIDLCIGVAPAPLTASGTNLKWYSTATGGTPFSSVVPPVTATGSTTWYVSQTTALGCEGPRNSLTVTVRPSPVVTITTRVAPAFVYCLNDSVVLKANSATATSYQWYKGTSALPGSVRDTYTVSTTADYTVIAKNTWGCADTERVTVVQNPLPKPVLSPDNVMICEGVSIMLYAKPATVGYRYDWSKDGIPMGVDTTFANIPVMNTGIYDVRVRDINGCIWQTNATSVTTYPAMPKPTLVRTGSTLSLTKPYATYQWYRNYKAIPGADAATYVMAFDGTYYAHVTDANGCEQNSDTLSMNTTGIQENKQNTVVKVFPNPTNGTVQIEAAKLLNARVVDISGRSVLEAKRTNTVDLSKFADGIYMLYLTDEEGVLLHAEKIQKQGN